MVITFLTGAFPGNVSAGISVMLGLTGRFMPQVVEPATKGGAKEPFEALTATLLTKCTSHQFANWFQEESSPSPEPETPTHL